MRWFKRKPVEPPKPEVHHLYLRADALPYRWSTQNGMEYYSPATDEWVYSGYVRSELLRDGFQELII